MYDGEPPEIKLARSEISNGNYEGALKALDKIDLAKINRAEIKEDAQFYRAMCHARMALGGSGDVSKAGSEMRAFVKEHPTNYHFLPASETLGDLFAAIGRPELAFAQYATIEKAPWPEYKMRGGVAKGRILVAQKKFPEALEAFDNVLKLAGDEKGAAASLKLAAQLGKATCLAATGQADAAIEQVQAVIDNADPEDVDLNARGVRDARELLSTKARRRQGSAGRLPACRPSLYGQSRGARRGAFEPDACLERAWQARACAASRATAERSLRQQRMGEAVAIVLDALLGPRMKLLVNSLQSRRIDVGVNLRGRDAGVAEHLLHLA